MIVPTTEINAQHYNLRDQVRESVQAGDAFRLVGHLTQDKIQACEAIAQGYESRWRKDSAGTMNLLFEPMTIIE